MERSNFHQFSALAVVSAIFAMSVGRSYPHPDFSVDFLAFTCFLGASMFSIMILIFATTWLAHGVGESLVNERIGPVGQASYVLFILGIFFAFVTYVTHQLAVATIVICSLLFIAMLVPVALFAYVTYTDQQSRVTSNPTV